MRESLEHGGNTAGVVGAAAKIHMHICIAALTICDLDLGDLVSLAVLSVGMQGPK